MEPKAMRKVGYERTQAPTASVAPDIALDIAADNYVQTCLYGTKNKGLSKSPPIAKIPASTSVKVVSFTRQPGH